MNSIKALSAVSLGLLLQTAFAGSITDIQVSVLPNKQRVVKLKFDKEMVEPSGFITATPARIALDFPGTNISVSQSALTFNDSLLNQIVAAQGSNHARILLSLAKEGQYSTQIKGNEVWVYVSEAVVTNTAPVQTAAAPAGERNSSLVQNAAVTSSAAPFNIDFRKGGSNTGVVEFTSAFSGEPKVSVQSDRIVITLKNYPLATRDQRNLDVTDFSTPIRSINVRRLGNDTQITLRNQGNWDHKINHNNGQYTIQVTPNRDIASAGASQRPASFKGKTISLDFQNVDVRTVLQIIAKESSMNIVASDSVQGKMTLSLKDVPWDQALDLVLTARGLDMRKQGNIINIAPREELLEQTRKEMTARKDIEELGPLFTRSFQLKYKNVEEFKEILKLTDTNSANNNRNNSILSSRGSALIDPSTNTLIITDNQKVIEKFERLIEELDVAARQVMVEARIVEASDGVSRDLGVKFGVARKGSTSWGSSYDNAMTNNTWGSGTVGTGILNPNVNMPVASATAGAISLVRSMSSGALGLELSALETENLTKTISNPRVLTQDRKEAEIKQGFQIPYTTRDSDGAVTTEFKDAVMSLKVTPRITPDNKVILDIVINKDQPDDTYVSTEGEPGISTKAVRTQAMVDDGGTLVVGGIYQEIYGNTIQKVPLLGDIPVLGNLFKSRSRNQSRNELLFFITPRIMGHEASVLRY